jgi:putative membrane protein
MPFLARIGYERAGFRRRTMTVFSLVAVIILPLIIGGSFAWSYGRRLDRVDTVPVAVVNLDEVATITIDSKSQAVAAGRLLAGWLTRPDQPSKTNLDWTLTDAGSASAGLHDGTYDAVLTIPKDFSAAVTSTSSNSPRQAVLSLASNDATSTLVSRISQEVVSRSAARLGRVFTKGYLDHVLIGFTDSASGARSAADGAQKLADGTTSLASGLVKLSGGAKTLASGSSSLSSGTQTLASGAGSLAGGARALAGGAQKLAGGASTAAGGAKKLAAGLRMLHDQTRTLPKDTASLASGASQVSTGVSALDAGLTGLAATCAQSGASPTYCGNVAGLAAVAGQVAPGAALTAGGLQKLSAGMPLIVSGISASSTGAGKLAGGMKALDTGTTKLATGAKTLASGATQLSGGAAKLASGTAQLSSGASQVAGGTTSAARGAGKLATGTTKLADGLSTGAGKVPTYTAAERKALVEQVTTPVTTQAIRQNKIADGAAVAIGLALPLVLWLGAFAAFLVLPSIPRRVELSTVSGWRATLHGWWPAAALGGLQALLMGLAIPLLHLHPVHPWLLGGVAILSAGVFTALNQALTAALGGLGRIISIIWLGVQGAALGGLIPTQTVPGPLRAFNTGSPVQLLSDLMNTATLGTTTTRVGTETALLLLWALGAVLLSVWAVGHGRKARARIQTSAGGPIPEGALA